MSERLPPGEKVVTVSAADPDLDADLVYEITEPVMARDKTGVTLVPSSPYDYIGAFRWEGHWVVVLGLVGLANGYIDF